MYNEIRSSDDAWFQSELLKLDCNKLVGRYYTPLILEYPFENNLSPIRTFIVTVDCYENENTGFEIIGFSIVLDWARSNGFEHPEDLKVRVHSRHTNFSGVLSKCGIQDKLINDKMRELEGGPALDWPLF